MKNIFIILLFSMLLGNSISAYSQEKPLDTIKLKSVLVSKPAMHSKNWYIFKNQYLERTNIVSNRIEVLKNKGKETENTTNNQFVNKVMILGQRNQSLVNRLNLYEKDKSNWSIFKKEFKKEFAAIEEDLRKLAIDGTF